MGISSAEEEEGQWSSVGRREINTLQGNVTMNLRSQTLLGSALSCRHKDDRLNIHDDRKVLALFRLWVITFSNIVARVKGTFASTCLRGKTAPKTFTTWDCANKPWTRQFKFKLFDRQICPQNLAYLFINDCCTKSFQDVSLRIISYYEQAHEVSVIMNELFYLVSKINFEHGGHNSTVLRTTSAI